MTDDNLGGDGGESNKTEAEFGAKSGASGSAGGDAEAKPEDPEVKLAAAADALSPTSTDDEVKAVLELLAEARIGFAAKRKILARAKKSTRQPIADLKRDLAPLEQKVTRAQRQAERLARGDTRPEFPAPSPNAEWLPQINVLDKVLGRGRLFDPEPPMRDVDGFATGVFVRRAVGLHTLTSAGANADETGATQLPAPEQPLLSRLSEAELAELIERHIAYVDNDEQLVHLGS